MDVLLTVFLLNWSNLVRIPILCIQSVIVSTGTKLCIKKITWAEMPFAEPVHQMPIAHSRHSTNHGHTRSTEIENEKDFNLGIENVFSSYFTVFLYISSFSFRAICFASATIGSPQDLRCVRCARDLTLRVSPPPQAANSWKMKTGNTYL